METPGCFKTEPALYQALPDQQRQSGFTLIEILIAVLIVSIIATIAVPGYGRYMTDARRSDALSILSEVAGEQQRYFSQYNRYAQNMEELGYPEQVMMSPNGHYSVAISNPDSTLKYVITATPVVGGKQADDDECAAFVINSVGAKSSTGTNKNCW